jgi:hypothetical protein
MQRLARPGPLRPLAIVIRGRAFKLGNLCGERVALRLDHREQRGVRQQGGNLKPALTGGDLEIQQFLDGHVVLQSVADEVPVVHSARRRDRARIR